MNKIYLIPLTLIILFSCKNQSETRQTLITFENALEYDENTISFESARFVKLENSEDAFIGEGVKMKMDDDKIYLMDNQNQGGLLCFNSEGNFINKIGQKGKGPEEYLNLYDFCLKDDTIDLLVRADKSFIYRYLQDGEFVGKIELEPRAMAFEYDFDGNYLVNTGYSHYDSCRIYILNKRGKILNTFLKNSGELAIDMVDPGNSFFKSEETILFCEVFNDTIYSYRDNELSPRYLMDFGSLTNSTIDKIAMFNDIESMLELLKRGMSAVRKSYENKDYLFIAYHRQKEGEKIKLYFLLYNKKSKNISTLVFDEDNAIINSFQRLNNDDELAFIVYPYGEELDDLKQLIPGVVIPELSENDNAMLVFCKISSDN